MADSATDRSDLHQERRITARPYNWPHDGTLSLATTALVVIDMQNDCKSVLLCTPALYHARLY